MFQRTSVETFPCHALDAPAPRRELAPQELAHIVFPKAMPLSTRDTLSGCCPIFCFALFLKQRTSLTRCWYHTFGENCCQFRITGSTKGNRLKGSSRFGCNVSLGIWRIVSCQAYLRRDCILTVSRHVSLTTDELPIEPSTDDCGTAFG